MEFTEAELNIIRHSLERDLAWAEYEDEPEAYFAHAHWQQIIADIKELVKKIG